MNRQFRAGQFEAFRALNQIHVGKYELDIKQDHSFEYDGSTVRYGGMEYGVPQLRGLYGSWYVEDADQTTRYVSRPADIQVSHATPEARDAGMKFTMEEASEEEAVVGTVSDQAEIREAARDGRQDRLAQLRASRDERGRRGLRASLQGRAGSTGEVVTDTNPNAPPPVNASDVDDEVESALMGFAEQSWASAPDEPTYQRAVPAHGKGIQGISPSEQLSLDQINEINRRAILAKVDQHDAYDAPKSRDQMGGQRHNALSEGKVVGNGNYRLLRDNDEAQVVKTYAFSTGAAVGDQARLAAQDQAVDVTRVGSKQPVQVGRAVAAPVVQNRASGALVTPDPTETVEPQGRLRTARQTQVPAEGHQSISDTLPGGGTGDVDESMSGDDLADLLPGAAVAGQIQRVPNSGKKIVSGPGQLTAEAVSGGGRVAPPPALSEDEEIAQIVDTWSTKRNWHKRVQEAVDYYGDWPEAIDAICAMESEKVAAQIRKRIEEGA